MDVAQSHHNARQHRTGRQGIEATSMASSRQFPRHAHDSYGLGLLDRGAHRTWSPVGHVEAVAGDVITANPEEMHDGAPVRSGARHWRMIYFDQALIAEAKNADSPRELEIARPVLRDAELRRRLDHLFAVVTATSVEVLAVDEAIAGVLMVVCHRHSADVWRPRSMVPGVARAREHLDDAPSASISLADLAALAGVSRFQLIRGFAREVGTTPHAYQVQRRVRMARRLISVGRSLAEAASAAGFADQSHMTRAFVRQLGLTPARYRDALGVAPGPQ